MPRASRPLDRRRAGVLLHPTSLPGPANQGLIGADARQFVDFLAESGFTVWQTLPVGPVDQVGSPYAQKSAFAGNPRLIDIADEKDVAWWPEGDPGDTWSDRRAHIAMAWRAFRTQADTESKAELDAFFREHRAWLMPYALFTARCTNPSIIRPGGTGRRT